jgi:hypothetical protein
MSFCAPRLGPASFTAVAAIGAVIVLGACSDDDKSNSPAPASTNADGGPVGPADPSAPGITAKDCPLTPTDVTLDKVAPVWGGLIVVESTVPGGAPDGIDMQILDPGRNEWTYSYGNFRQKADGKYLSFATPNPRESTKGSEFKLRIRARLSGCPPTAWVETPGFTLGDPITGTTWRADIPAGFLNGSVSVQKFGGTGTTTGPYSVTQNPASHQVTFSADGSFAETYGFTVTSKTNGDLYKDCAFQLTYGGTWKLQFVNDSPNIFISDRKPKAGAATTGSTCAAPPLADLEINQPTTPISIPFQSIGLGMDYAPLRDTPPGKPTWSNNGFANGFNYVTGAVQDVVGPDTSNLTGGVYPSYSTYQKQ